MDPENLLNPAGYLNKASDRLKYRLARVMSAATNRSLQPPPPRGIWDCAVVVSTACIDTVRLR